MALFEPAWAITSKQEGGYQNYAEDPGNYNSQNRLVGTNWGISAPVFEAYLGHPPTESEVRNMKKETAAYIAKRFYWDKYKVELIKDQFLANHIFDIIWGRPYLGSKIIQQTINEITPGAVAVDGIFGRKSAAAVNNIVDMGKGKQFNDLLMQNRIASYPNNPTFIQGWINQAKEYANYIPQIIKTHSYGIMGITAAIIAVAIFTYDEN